MVVMTSQAEAQFQSPLGVQNVSAQRVSARTPKHPTYAFTDSTRSAKPYVVAGAAIGALLGAAGLAIYFNHSDSEFVASPIALLPIIVVSSGLGAGIGFFLFRARN
jgi:hypothetical protein